MIHNELYYADENLPVNCFAVRNGMYIQAATADSFCNCIVEDININGGAWLVRASFGGVVKVVTQGQVKAGDFLSPSPNGQAQVWTPGKYPIPLVQALEDNAESGDHIIARWL